MYNNLKLRLLYWNADGIRSKIVELQDLVRALDVDIIALCETRISPCVNLNTPGFHCYRQDKVADGRGQGVAILIKEDIPHVTIKIPRTHNLEAIGIQLCLSGKIVTFIAAYQSPNLPLLCNDLDIIINTFQSVVIMGDLNTKHPYWSPSATNLHGKILFDHMINNEYDVFAPSTPTLVHYNSSYAPSTPDVVIAHGVKDITDMEAITALSSNHLPIFFTIDGTYERKSFQTYNYKKADWPKFRKFLDQNITLDIPPFKSKSEIDSKVEFLSNTLAAARDYSIPVIKVDSKIKLPRHIRKLIKIKNACRRVSLKEKDKSVKRYYLTKFNALKSKINQEIQKFNDKLWDKKLTNVDNPSSDVWRLVKSLNPKVSTIPPLKITDDSFTSSTQDQCEVLAEAFLDNMNLTKHWNSDSETERIVAESVTKIESFEVDNNLNKLVRPREIRKVLNKLKPRKAPGYDGITNYLLKHISQKCLVLLTKIYNGCLSLGYFPNSWKTAKMIAIKKPGKDESFPSSYRPISLLPSMGKIFESLILNRLQAATDHLLIPEQFGFRRNHSTTHQLARVAEHAAHGMNLGQCTGMVLLDIEKAFDSVWHEGLLHKLLVNNVPLCLIKLVQSYLANRSFSVAIGDHKSSLKHTPAGVPQGSILGPYLFTLFINDIPKQPHTQLAIYADDTATYTTSKDGDLVIGRLQLSLELLSDFFTKWKLKLNPDKTESIMFSRKRTVPDRKIKFKNYTIPWSRQVKYLGVTLDDKLNWGKNTDNLVLKGAKTTNALRPVLNRKSKLSSTTKLRIYSTLIRPCITYAAPVWCSITDNKYSKLQVIQNKAIKIAYNTPFRTNLKKLHKKIKYPVLKDFILKVSEKFYLRKNPAHQNILVSTIGRSRYGTLPYIDTYNRYRLPHHYFLGDS